MLVMKFGGSSVATSERIKNVIAIVADKYRTTPQLVVVVSAMGGVTDELIETARQAVQAHPSYLEKLEALKARHLSAVADLIPEIRREAVLANLAMTFQELTDALHGVALVKELSKRTQDFVMSFGERLSAYIISEGLKASVPSAVFADARDFVATDSTFGSARVRFEATNANIREKLILNGALPVVTGFIGSTSAQETTTLGRGGSDYTAAIIGAALGVDEIEIWTDVDGVMTADPRKVKGALAVPAMSYNEALEMSHFGAKVIHPPTIAPALHANIPLRIKNSFNPSAVGTLIARETPANGAMIRGISSIDDVALLRVEGSGMVGVCGVAGRLFGALAKKEISVILISQASSEHSICFAVAPQNASLAKEAIEDEFALEMRAGVIDEVVVEGGVSIVAVVGENMRCTPGTAGKLFGALGRNGISVVAIAQGSSEYNISVIINRADEVKALNVLHEEFFLSHITTLHVFLVGKGLIGRTLLEQIQRQAPILLRDHNIDIRLVGLANSGKMHFDANGIKLDNGDASLEASTEPMDMSSYIHRMKKFNLSNTIFVDCTASEQIADAYQEILQASISIVTPNKKANSGRYETYRALQELSKRRGVKFLYEANVGAGLPVISTVIDLLRSGDRVLKIEGILSGTLSYLFNSFKGGAAFSDIVRGAQQRGFTEPDPRDDLNGMDVKRKLLILARVSGYPLEIEDIVLESLLPDDCAAATGVEHFYEQLKKHDAAFEAKRAAAAAQGKVLRYIASFDSKQALVGLQAVGPEHPLFHLSGSDNVIAITTERYRENPLVIKGQGAGAEVTAGELLADIVRIAAR